METAKFNGAAREAVRLMASAKAQVVRAMLSALEVGRLMASLWVLPRR